MEKTMSQGTVVSFEEFADKVGQSLRKFLEVTHTNIDLSLEKVGIYESRKPNGVVSLYYQGYTLEELDNTPEGVMPPSRLHQVDVLEDEDGVWYLEFPGKFKLIQGYRNMKRLEGTPADNNRHLLSALLTCLTDILTLCEDTGQAVSTMIFPGNFYQSYTVSKVENTHSGLYLEYKESYGSFRHFEGVSA